MRIVGIKHNNNIYFIDRDKYSNFDAIAKNPEGAIQIARISNNFIVPLWFGSEQAFAGIDKNVINDSSTFYKDIAAADKAGFYIPYQNIASSLLPLLFITALLRQPALDTTKVLFANANNTFAAERDRLTYIDNANYKPRSISYSV